MMQSESEDYRNVAEILTSCSGARLKLSAKSTGA